MFVLKRDIPDNVLVAHELLSLFSKNLSKKGDKVIKLDVEKSNDRLNWDLIRKCFIDLDFRDMD